MVIDKIRDLINKKLAGDWVPEDQMLPFMDEVIDDINARLNSFFPLFSEVLSDPENTTQEYTSFPDKYQRTVVVYGAASKWFTMDEEGIATAPTYSQDYTKYMFLMERDYIDHVPDEFRSDPTGYYENKPHLERGVFVGGLEDIISGD